MNTNRCGECRCYEPYLEPDGHRNGMGFCLSLFTKQVSGEFEAPVGMVANSAPSCSQFISFQVSAQESRRVEALLTPPSLPPGVVIERAIEIQAGKCLRQQESMAAKSDDYPPALDREQRRVGEIQIAAALTNPRFFGRIVLVFGGTDETSLLGWKVKLFPPGGEIRT